LNPNSFVTLPPAPAGGENPSIEAIKPELDTDSMLRYVESLIAMLLTTKNLSVASISGKLSVGNLASGAAKMIEEAVSTEDRNDQISFFEHGEILLWDLFSQKMLPYWVQNNLVNKKYVGKFSDSFELAIKFPDMKPMVGDREKIETVLLKLENGLISRKGALKEIDPELTLDQIADLLLDIDKEKVDFEKFIERNLLGQANTEDRPDSDSE
jgi:hypothetical protein